MSSRALGVLNFIEAKDHQLMRLLHHWRAPRWIRLWMVCATRGGDGWLWFCLAAVLIVFGQAEGLAAVAESSLAAAVGVALFLALKRTTGRRRPCALEPHCWSSLLPPDQFSFPSGHTITAFAVVLPVVSHFPGMAAGLWFCAASIGVSRMLLGMHFLSDVVAGGILGALLGTAAHLLLR